MLVEGLDGEHHLVTELFIGSAPTVAACSPWSPPLAMSPRPAGGSIRMFVQTARRYRTVHIRVCGKLLSAED